MDGQSLREDIDTAEGLDEAMQEQSACIEDIYGSLEAIDVVISDELPLTELTEHQKDRVEAFNILTNDLKNPVYAVADKAALEGLLDIVTVVSDKALNKFKQEIPVQLKLTATSLRHYSKLATDLKKRITLLRPLLVEREYPLHDVFEYGAYARFFISNGKSIKNFTDFQKAMSVQSAATMHTVAAGESYTPVVMDRLLGLINTMQTQVEADAEAVVELRESIDFNWRTTWEEANFDIKRLAPLPKEIAAIFPERKYTHVAPLLDNRFLAAYKPKGTIGIDYGRNLQAIKNYGCAVVTEKKTSIPYEKTMNIPNCKDLLTLVDQVTVTLDRLGSLESLAKKNDEYARTFRQAIDVLIKRKARRDEDTYYPALLDYFRAALTLNQTLYQPYTEMAWMYIRCALVVVGMVELSVFVEEEKQITANRYFTKQSKFFMNHALESFATTRRVLRTAGGLESK